MNFIMLLHLHILLLIYAITCLILPSKRRIWERVLRQIRQRRNFRQWSLVSLCLSVPSCKSAGLLIISLRRLNLARTKVRVHGPWGDDCSCAVFTSLSLRLFFEIRCFCLNLSSNTIARRIVAGRSIMTESKVEILLLTEEKMSLLIIQGIQSSGLSTKYGTKMFLIPLNRSYRDSALTLTGSIRSIYFERNKST